MLNPNNTTAQLGLFTRPVLQAIHPAVETKTLSRDEIWDKFKAEFDSAILYPSNPLTVQIPTSEAIAAMAALQCRDQKGTRRARPDCDRVALMGYVAAAKAIGQDARDVYIHWERSLGKGDGGCKWRFPREAIGLRCSSGGKTTAYLSKNRGADRLTGFAFANVETRHDGSAWVTLQGLAWRYQIGPWMRDCGQYWSVSLDVLRRQGLLMPFDVLRSLYQADGEGVNHG